MGAIFCLLALVALVIFVVLLLGVVEFLVLPGLRDSKSKRDRARPFRDFRD